MAAAAYVIPTDAPESDGTFEWTSTTLVVAHVEASGARGLGYTYADRSAALVISGTLAPQILGGDALDVPGLHARMRRAVRNAGQPGIGATAVSAVDTALWDLKARLLGVSLGSLLGRVREAVPAYGSGGFTSYASERLCRQLAGWIESGMLAVKMKVGRDAAADAVRVREARRAIGDGPSLFVDANGAWTAGEALRLVGRLAAADVSWLEEPVSSDDLDGLVHVRRRVPAGVEVAAGEYGWGPAEFRRLLERRAVDVLQADATRCGGVTGFLAAGALCDAFHLPLSAHTAPSLHAVIGGALTRLRHVEYFHDHVRIEHMLFDGAPRAEHGMLRPAASAPGLGLVFKEQDAAGFRVL